MGNRRDTLAWDTVRLGASEWVYDGLGRVKVSKTSASADTIAYDAAGRVIRRINNGDTISMTYDSTSSLAPAASDVQDALAIAAALAERHGLTPRSPILPQDLAAYFAEINDSNATYPMHNELNLAISQLRDGTISFALSEAITRTWSSKGDSLRSELPERCG